MKTILVLKPEEALSIFYACQLEQKSAKIQATIPRLEV
jgi:hypothetical protein